eukprot:c30964_g1_i1 orf=432-764(+)
MMYHEQRQCTIYGLSSPFKGDFYGLQCSSSFLVIPLVHFLCCNPFLYFAFKSVPFRCLESFLLRKKRVLPLKYKVLPHHFEIEDLSKCCTSCSRCTHPAPSANDVLSVNT